MADVTRDRGQLILITGFALAFTLVAIVLLLNTVIYTENIASRGVDRSGDQALAFRAAVVEGLSDSLVQTNLDGYETDSTVQTAYNDTLTNLSQMFTRIHIDEGTVAEVNISTLSMRPGALLRQTNRSRNFTDIDGDQNWVLARDVNATRRATFFVKRSSLESGDVTDILTGFTPYGLRLVGASNNWTVYLSTNTANEIVLSTSQNGGSATKHCAVVATNAAVDLTGDGIEGVDCGSYEWAEGISSNYTIRFIEAQDIEGSYNLTVNTDGPGTVETSNFNTDASTDPDPHMYRAVYSATIGIRYETSTMVYETTIRVAPGEPNDD